MKILHTTDLHFTKHWFAWITSQQAKYDVFCITGDFLESSKEEPLKKQIDWVAHWMQNFKKPLFVCSGNHDIEELENQDWLDKIPNVYGDNSIKTINGIKFGCAPFLAPDFFEFDECNVLLYHLPPSSSKTAIHKTTNADWGDKELLRLLKKGFLKPKILLCGHLHYPIDTIDKIGRTTIYNTGVDKNKEMPNHFAIEI